MARTLGAAARQLSLAGLDLSGESESTAAALTTVGSLRAWDPSSWPVASDWRERLDGFFASPAGRQLAQFVQMRLAAGAVVYPAHPLWALALTPLERVKVVILGQDPYHGPGQAQGLAFSVAPGVPVPPSLRNILRERSRDLGPAGGRGPTHSLQAWAEQGVLLLNGVLTVEQGQAASHAKKGWEVLTSSLLSAIIERVRPAVFMAWGAHAQAQLAGVPARHLVLSANHPSPLSASRPPRPFVGCAHFSAANAWLLSQGQEPISW